MRLINTTTLVIEEFLSEDKTPPFAILSHTWEEEECTLMQMQNAETSLVRERKGYQKIRRCCEQALEDGLQWAWVDTCCIDKTSTAELSEAINSMFRWYQIANVCYAFLSDVTTVASMPSSRWFTRGWTLQELVAPTHVQFFNYDWCFLGSKLDLNRELHTITTIDKTVLLTGDFKGISIATRMAWAAGRQTTRVEDRAYSLMGIFDVHMPLLYGEGHNAFARLQEAIMKISDDQSLFAWGFPEKLKTSRDFLLGFETPGIEGMRGIFAETPADFKFSDRIHVLQDLQSTVPPIVSNKGVRIELQVYRPPRPDVLFAVLYCTIHGNYKNYLGFPIVQWGGRWAARCGELVMIAVSDLVPSYSETPYTQPEVLLLKAPTVLPPRPASTNDIRLIQTLSPQSQGYHAEVYHAKHALYSKSTGILTLSQDIDTLHAVFIFTCRDIDPKTLFNRSRQSGPKGGPDEEDFHRSSFKIISNAYTYRHCYTAVFPAFAVLVGGPIASPWVETVVVMDDHDSEDEFRRLHAASGDLVRRCTKKEKLFTLLAQDHPKVPLGRERAQSDQQVVMLWEEAQAWRAGPFKKTDDHGKLLVSTHIRMVTTNLIQRGLLLFVTIAPEGDMTHQAKLDGLKWWNIQDPQ